VGALTTLFPISAVTDPQGLGSTLLTSISRGENVLVGCAVALVLDWLLWPERPARRLSARLREDVAAVGLQALAWLRVYVRGAESPAEPSLQQLLNANVVHADLLGLLATEPEERGASRARFTAQTEAVHTLIEHCHTLRDLVGEAREDRVQQLLAGELEELGEHLEACAQAFGAGDGFPASLVALHSSRVRLDAAYARVRGDQGTQAYPVQEVFHFVGVIAACHGLERALRRLEAL